MVPASDEAYDVYKPRVQSEGWNDRKICFAHKEQKWWVSIRGVRRCGICCPPACERVVATWEKGD